MTQEPDPTLELDMSELPDELDEEENGASEPAAD